MHISIDQSKHNLIVSHIFLALFRFKICDCVVESVFKKCRCWWQGTIFQQLERIITSASVTIFIRVKIDHKTARSTVPPGFKLTNISHVAERLFSDRSQMTLKCGKNKPVVHKARLSVSLVFLPHLDVLNDKLYRLIAIWKILLLYV